MDLCRNMSKSYYRFYYIMIRGEPNNNNPPANKNSFTSNWLITLAQWCRAKETNNHKMHCTYTCSAIDQSMPYSKESSAKSLTGIYVDHKSVKQSEKIAIRCNASISTVKLSITS